MADAKYIAKKQDLGVKIKGPSEKLKSLIVIQ